MSYPPPHRTPLRRVSRGSLAAISRSGNFPDAPSGLGFMGPALESLADETEALHANLEGLNALAASLETFNESFASYLFIQKVNAYCVEWYQVYDSVSQWILVVVDSVSPQGTSGRIP